MRLDMPRDRIILLFASLAVMLPLMHFYWPAGNGLDVIGYPLGRDFINVWSGPQVAFGDKVATLFDVRAYHAAIDVLFGQPIPFHNWGYPLTTLPAFWPLAQLPYFWALAVWTFGLFAIFAAVVLSQVAPERRLQALALLALTPACLINVIGGQNGFLSAALFLGGVLSIDRRPVLSGVLIGLLTFKPHLGVVLPFALVALGAWRVMAVAAATALAMFLVSTAMFGLDAWRDYISVVGAYQVRLLSDFAGFYTFMMVSVLASLRLAGMSYAVAWAIQMMVALCVIALSCWAVRRIADPCARAFLLASAALLCTPYGFNYDMTAVGACLVWTMVGRLPQHAEAGPAYTVIWLAPPVAMMLAILELGIAPVITLCSLVATLALAALPALRGRQTSRLAAA
jgi:hypothetical protein